MVAAAQRDGVRFFVYALCEPDGKTVRYVGVTRNLWKRLGNHWRHSTVPAIRQWVWSLRSVGLVPSLVVLRQVDGIENAIEAEREEIVRHRRMLGDQLLNELETGKRQRRRKFGVVTFAGKSLTKTEWARELGISKQALDLRLQKHPIEVALSRGKDHSKPLSSGVRHAPPEISELVTMLITPVDPATVGVTEADKLKTGLTHSQRQNRRRKMACLIDKGMCLGDVAALFAVSTATVRLAVDEFSEIATST